MSVMPRRMDVQQAAEDLRRRTLSEIPRSLDRLIYLASMRDYNTGLYYHDGLASRFSQEVACEALADCHREAFRDLVGSPLRDLVCQMEGYMDSTHTSPSEFLTAWKKLNRTAWLFRWKLIRSPRNSSFRASRSLWQSWRPVCILLLWHQAHSHSRHLPHDFRLRWIGELPDCAAR